MAAVIDEVFTPHTLLVPDNASPALSISACFLDGLIKQLQPLYEPMDPSGFSTAAEMNLPVPAAGLAGLLMDELCTLIAFEAPSNASTLHSLRQDNAVARSPLRRGVAPDKALHVRYLVCRSFDAIADIAGDNFDRLPVNSPVFLSNEVSNFWQRLVARNGGRMRRDEVRGGAFRTSVDYRRSYPEARRASEDQHLPAYDLVRKCTEEDVRERVAASDPISLMLFESGVEPADVCLVVGHHRLCGPRGPESFLEEYLLRPIWALLAEFVVDETVRFSLDSWRAYVQDSGVHGLAAVTDPLHVHPESGRLPRAPIEPGQSVVIPLATLVPRFPLPPEHHVFLDSDSDKDGRYQELKITMFRREELSLDVWGPARIPIEVDLTIGAERHTSDVREFEPNLMYTIDRSWYSGSCPHIFEVHGRDRIIYHGTAFGEAPGIEQAFRVETDPGATHLVVAELESEVTFISQLLVDGHLRAAEKCVTSGNWFAVALEPGNRTIELHGYYALSPETTVASSSSERNAVVRDFMRRFRVGPSSSVR